MKAAIPRNRRGKQLHRPVDGEEGSTTSTKQGEAQHQSKEGEKGKQRHPEGGGIRQHHPQHLPQGGREGSTTHNGGERQHQEKGTQPSFGWHWLHPFSFVWCSSMCGAAVTIGVFGVVLLSSLLLWIGTAFTIFLDPDICRVLLRIGAFFDVDCGNQRTHCNPLSFFSVQPKP